ncbi:hypothetical protein PROFUN_14599 [Planoprotostelium fungivorum]|uniref:Uncharacterized protein n=1 Tax=Planoprotostelium fungivorum TaxID=1890364 RepID=A0A2P6MZI1_9EUKA|nr:hypothetical protein PROFUN_14599 [Planoprotostelium fungivorum]
MDGTSDLPTPRPSLMLEKLLYSDHSLLLLKLLLSRVPKVLIGRGGSNRGNFSYSNCQPNGWLGQDGIMLEHCDLAWVRDESFGALHPSILKNRIMTSIWE